MASTFFIITAFAALLVYVIIPITIARLSQLGGRYRVIVMLILIVTVWLLILLPSAFMFGGDRIARGAIAASVLSAVVVVISTIVIINPISNFLARRYAPSVADAIATVITGIIASVGTPAMSLLFLTLAYLPDILQSGSTEAIELSIQFKWLDFFTLYGLLATATGATAWLILGLGSISTLRRAKATVIGIIAVSMAVCFSIIPASGITFARHTLLNTAIDPNEYLLQAVDILTLTLLVIAYAAVSIGMLAAGLTVGILKEFAAVLNFVTYLVVLVLIFMIIYANLWESKFDLTRFSYVRVYSQNGLSLFFGLLLVTVILQLRSVMVGDKVTTIAVAMVTAGIFITSTLLSSPDGRLERSVILLLTYISLIITLWLGGLYLRQLKYAGYITSALTVLALISIPLIVILR